MHTAVREFVLWSWCLPQTLLGLAVYGLMLLTSQVVCSQEYKGITLLKLKRSQLMGGLALGKFNFVTENNWNENTLRHEYGHTRQGYVFGPLYILFVGLPSEFWLLLSHISPRIKKTYRSRYPESWADRLGGVTRRS